MNKKRFAIMGVAGFVASRHLDAIKENGGICVAANDPHDSVGILDSYFPECKFFTEFGRFERYLEKLKLEDGAIDFLVVCTPNFLHDSHVRFGLRYGCDVICEKPLAINPHNVNAIIQAEKEYKHTVWNILQLRLHPAFRKIQKLISGKKDIGLVKLRYHAPRGDWYHNSWKGDNTKSGGIMMNIGVHFFDVLLQLFGTYDFLELGVANEKYANGKIIFQNVEVDWQLDISQKPKMEGERGIEIMGKKFDFTGQFKNLHIESYRKILSGEGFHSESVLPSIELVSKLRIQNQKNNYVGL